MFARDVEETQTELPEMKTTVSEMKSTFDQINHKLFRAKQIRWTED